MRRQFFSIFVLLSCWAVAPVSRGQTIKELRSAGSTELSSLIIADDTITIWSGGALVFVQKRFSSAPMLRILDRNGTQVSQFEFSIPGARLINIYDNSVARGSDGSLAIAGTAYSEDSRGSMFVAWVSPGGQKQTIIRTSPFFPAALTIASDGAIWVVGHETKEHNQERDFSRPLVRRYDKTGKLLGSFIPWATLGTAPHTVPFAFSMLLALKDSVLWYVPGVRSYFEFSLDGSIINKFKSAPHPEFDIAFVAACDDGGMFASTRIHSAGQPVHWGVFTLDQQSGEWSLIPRNEKWGTLLGCDGTRLATTTDNKTISWLETTGK